MAKSPNWSKEEVQILIKNYENSTKEELESLLPRRNFQAIMIYGNRKGLHRMNYFTKKELSIIKKNYNKIRSGEIAKMIGRSIGVVENKAREIGLRKQEKWTKKELRLLKNNFSKFTVKYIKKNIIKDRSISSINHMAQSLKLQKIKKRYNDVSNEKLVFKFKNLCLELGRTIRANELSRFDFPSYTTICKRFDSYRNFCNLAELEVNSGYPKPYRGISKNGENCASNAEKVISDFLFDNNITYKKEVPYNNFIPNHKSRLRSDWLLENGTVIEFFGMSRHEKYKKKMKRKIILCKKYNIRLIELYEKDLSKLKEKIIPFIK